MKKIAIISLAAAMCLGSADMSAKKKKDKKKGPAKIEAAQLATTSDTLSYTAGMTFTNGLIPFLEKQLDVDTAYMSDVMRGFNEMIAGGDDPRFKAYAAGISIAAQVKNQMLAGAKREFGGAPDSIVDKSFYRGFTDAMLGDTTHFTTDKAESTFKALRTAIMKAKNEKLYGPNREAGKKFLADNALNDSVRSTPSGLQFKVITMGNGPVPKATDRVRVHYEGRLIDGKVFDASKRHGTQPAVFGCSQVIKGWTEALTMMPVGSKWQLYIPYELAYGERDLGDIKPYSTLIFDVELVGIEGQGSNVPATQLNVVSKQNKQDGKMRVVPQKKAKK